MIYVLYAIAAWITLGALLAIAMIGKTRTPITPSTAIVMVVIDALIVVALILAAGDLR